LANLEKIDLIIKVLELVDMTMVAQLVWVVALAGVSLFVTTGHFRHEGHEKAKNGKTTFTGWTYVEYPTTSS
jgi:uncharacterized membrane protein YqhA